MNEESAGKLVGSILGTLVVVGIYYFFLKSFKKVLVAIIFQAVLSPFLLVFMLPLAMANDTGAAPTSVLIFIILGAFLLLFALFAIPIYLTNWIFGNPTPTLNINAAAKQIGGFLKAIRRA